jgi:hypothetical protein
MILLDAPGVTTLRMKNPATSCLGVAQSPKPPLTGDVFVPISSEHFNKNPHAIEHGG